MKMTFLKFKNLKWKDLKFRFQILFSTLIIIRNVLTNWHIRLISEGSWDSRNWSNDVENSAFHHSNKLHLKILV